MVNKGKKKKIVYLSLLINSIYNNLICHRQKY